MPGAMTHEQRQAQREALIATAYGLARETETNLMLRGSVGKGVIYAATTMLAVADKLRDDADTSATT